MSRDRFRNRGGFQQRGRGGGGGMRGGMGTPNFRNTPQHSFQNRGPQPGGGFKPNQGNQANQVILQKPEGSNVTVKPDIKSPPPTPQQQPDAQNKAPAQQQQVQPPPTPQPPIQSPPPKNINTKPEPTTPQNQPRKNQQKTPVSGNGQKPPNNDGQTSRAADTSGSQVRKKCQPLYHILFIVLAFFVSCFVSYLVWLTQKSYKTPRPRPLHFVFHEL